MNRPKRLDPRALERERILFRYSSALERGDFEAVADILRKAESDPVLEQKILEINEAYSAELPLAAPSLNHNHRNMRENESMTIYRYSNHLPHALKGRNRGYSVTLAAALLALVGIQCRAASCS